MLRNKLDPYFVKFAFFGSDLVSAYWNGTATCYHRIIRAMNERGT
jgi:spore maturation protein CgeB